MDGRAMALLLRMLEIRKERAAMASRSAQQAYLKAKNFSQQVDAYAHEYDLNWARSVSQGDRVDHLQAQAAFTDRLQDTAAEQRQEAHHLEQESQRALSKVVQESERVRAIRQWQDRQTKIQKLQQARREERAMEDVIQARHPLR